MPMKHACSCVPKCTSAVCANQRCTRTVCTDHDAHGSRLTSHVYTCAANVHFYPSLIFRAHAGYFVCIFENMSSRVVGSRVCSQV